jgi:hypothetical protein
LEEPSITNEYDPGTESALDLCYIAFLKNRAQGGQYEMVRRSLSLPALIV